jgi:hypothetical protein
MRIVLAIVAFVIALPCLGYGAFLFYVLGLYVLGFDIHNDVGLVLRVGGVALLIGVTFAGCGLAMLAQKSRRREQ